jgi:hypothetical protein
MRAHLLLAGYITAKGFLITWTGNGNPALPLCPANVKKSCVSGFSLNGGGLFVTLPPTAKQYLVTKYNGSQYYVRTNGYDYKGNAISSAYETVPVK